jgi:long-chain acyl-CoA synthetase
MLGAVVAHTRSIQDLPEDLLMVRPEGLISVPRIFERVYARIKENLSNGPFIARYLFSLAVSVGWGRFEYNHQRRSWSPLFLLWPILKLLVADKIITRLGGNLKVAISGGSALSPEISRVFIGLGVPLFQGYGLTETSPVVSVNTVEHNIPTSIGRPLQGVDVKIGENDELMVKGESVMMGYWQDEEATKRVIDVDGWLHTGDKARIDDGYIFITGRLKDIIVMANGEKVAPVDMEHAILEDPLFEQVMVIGESRPHLAALAVFNDKEWQRFASENNFQDAEKHGELVEKAILERISEALHEFPGYAQVYQLGIIDEPWTVDNDMLTSTLKMKRNKIEETYQELIDSLYQK